MQRKYLAVGLLSQKVARQTIMRNDSRLALVIERSPGFRARKSSRHLEMLVGSIISQQLSGKVADKIFDRLDAYFQGKITAENILATEDAKFREFGMSFAKINCVKELASEIKTKNINLGRIKSQSNEDVIRQLTKVKGIGEWTAQMYLMFGLARLDILPVNDFGILKAIKNLYKLKEMPDTKKVIAISEKNKWAPYRTIASWYLWRSLEPVEK